MIPARSRRCASSLASPNDRLRTVAYSFFEHNPEREMVPRLLAVAREGAGRVRPAGAGPGARRTRRQVRRPAAARDADQGGRPRRGLLPRRRHRGARRLQGAVRLRRDQHRRQARRSASGRRGGRAREARRQARARDAGGTAAHRPQELAAVDRREHLPARRQLRLARGLSDRDAEVRRREPRLPGTAARRRLRAGRARSGRADDRGRRVVGSRPPVPRSDAGSGGAGAGHGRAPEYSDHAVAARAPDPEAIRASR